MVIEYNEVREDTNLGEEYNPPLLVLLQGGEGWRSEFEIALGNMSQ